MSPSASTDPAARHRRLGGRLVRAAYWAILLYFCGVGLVAVPRHIFWPETASPDRPADCARGLRALRDELLREVGRTFAARGGGGAPAPWLEQWDRDHEALRAACRDEGAPIHAALGRARHGLEALLHRAGDREARLLDQVDRWLRSTPTTPNDGS